MPVKSPLEKDFQRFVLSELRKLPYSWWVKLNDRTTIGLPDIIGFFDGSGFAFELKTTSKVSAIQAYTLKRIVRAGAAASVLTPETFPAVLARLRERAQKAEFNERL